MTSTTGWEAYAAYQQQQTAPPGTSEAQQYSYDPTMYGYTADSTTGYDASTYPGYQQDPMQMYAGAAPGDTASTDPNTMTHEDYYRQWQASQIAAGVEATATVDANNALAEAGYKGHYDEHGIYVPSQEELEAYTAAQKEAWKAYYEQAKAQIRNPFANITAEAKKSEEGEKKEEVSPGKKAAKKMVVLDPKNLLAKKKQSTNNNEEKESEISSSPDRNDATAKKTTPKPPPPPPPKRPAPTQNDNEEVKEVEDKDKMVESDNQNSSGGETKLKLVLSASTQSRLKAAEEIKQAIVAQTEDEIALTAYDLQLQQEETIFVEFMEEQRRIMEAQNLLIEQRQREYKERIVEIKKAKEVERERRRVFREQEEIRRKAEEEEMEKRREMEEVLRKEREIKEREDIERERELIRRREEAANERRMGGGGYGDDENGQEGRRRRSSGGVGGSIFDLEDEERDGRGGKGVVRRTIGGRDAPAPIFVPPPPPEPRRERDNKDRDRDGRGKRRRRDDDYDNGDDDRGYGKDRDRRDREKERSRKDRDYDEGRESSRRKESSGHHRVSSRQERDRVDPDAEMVIEKAEKESKSHRVDREKERDRDRRRSSKDDSKSDKHKSSSSSKSKSRHGEESSSSKSKKHRRGENEGEVVDIGERGTGGGDERAEDRMEIEEESVTKIDVKDDVGQSEESRDDEMEGVVRVPTPTGKKDKSSSSKSRYSKKPSSSSKRARSRSRSRRERDSKRKRARSLTPTSESDSYDSYDSYDYDSYDSYDSYDDSEDSEEREAERRRREKARERKKELERRRKEKAKRKDKEREREKDKDKDKDGRKKDKKSSSSSKHKSSSSSSRRGKERERGEGDGGEGGGVEVGEFAEKVKAISRSEEVHTRSRSGDLHKLHRNLNPIEHPFERAREYTRALNAVKLDRLFAKPFVGAMTGHRDGVYCMAKHPTHLTTIISGSADGEIRLWSLQNQQTLWKSSNGHKGFVRGITVVPYSDSFLSVGDDKVVRLWNRNSEDPVSTLITKFPFTGVDHHRSQPRFATSSTQIEIWEHERSEPIMSLTWGAETITTVKFNQTETSILASAGTDRTITLYDLRTSQPISKSILALRTNAIAWNPMEAFNFTAANEDHNLYSFDMRNLSKAINVLKDHVSAVLDVDYSPTGQEIVSGSYDKTIRIFNAREGHSRETYHTKRMQKIFCVKYTMDSKYVLSGSDDGNIRLWKAVAQEKMGALAPREQTALNYKNSLKERFKHMPEIKRIDRQRHLPKAVVSATKKKRVMIDSRKNKEENRRKHSAPGSVPYQAERKKNIITVQK
ncbi:DDB1- and CUL4-associated factor 13 [Blyttiomyces sp. JEL0837]|nr:DDB1- and CUL4-associated factor 13 [Blyttiomyces sp. JEL0837]